MPNKPPKVDTIDRREMASQYGWALSVLKSSPDLAAVFDKAVKQTWSPARFIAEVRGTEWFQTHSEASRNATVLRTTDPKTYAARLNQTRSLVRDAAVGLGAQVSDNELTRLSKNVLNFGWNDAQIRDTLAGAIKTGARGTYGGEAEQNAQSLRQTALKNGVKISDATLRNWLVRVGAGEGLEGFDAYVRKTAAGAFPHWAKEIEAGMDVADLASPYMQQMAQTLELNDKDIDLFDPTIRKTLQSTDADGKPVSKPLWQFERELKQDGRWRGTNNARDELMGAGQQILKDFGLSA